MYRLYLDAALRPYDNLRLKSLQGLFAKRTIIDLFYTLLESQFRRIQIKTNEYNTLESGSKKAVVDNSARR
jgi:hypothetical protein